MKKFDVYLYKKKKMNSPTDFPTKDIYRALDVTEPYFKIQSNPELFKKLWVDFSKVRTNTHFKQMKKRLGIDEKTNKLVYTSGNYLKFIYSGHRGSGKSVEMNRFANEINHKDAYFSIFIDLETETNIEQLSAEDIYIVLITMLIRKLEENNINFEKNDLNDIADEWLSETEVVKDLKNSFNIGADAKVGVGWNFWNFFKTEGNLKSGFSRDNITTKIIRRIIKSNPKPLREKFNTALVNIRKNIIDENKGKDIIFFIDGLEKANRTVYEDLFIRDIEMLTALNVNIISTVPIDTYYRIIEQGNRFYFKDFYLPMIRISEESIELFKDMIYKRIDKSLIEDKSLEYLIKMSGGCPRILLKMVNRALLETDNNYITQKVAEEVVLKEGNERYRTLTGEHKKRIKEGDFESADPIVLELLHSLTILEYNGLNPERKLNPVLEKFFK